MQPILGEQGKFYTARIATSDLDDVLRIYNENLGTRWVTDSFKDQARGIVGISMPDLDAMEMRADRAPVAALRGDELGAWEDIRQLGKKAEAWYRNNLVGTIVTMERTGWKIQFGRVGSKKLGGRKGDVLLRLVPALPDIIKNAELVSSERGAKAGTERQTFHKLSAPVSLVAVEYPVVVTIREDANGKFHYDLSMDNTISSGAADRVTEARSGQPDDNGGESRNGSEARQSNAQLRDPAFAGAFAALNLEFAPASRKGDAAITDEDMRGIARDLNAMPEIVAMGGRVPVRVVRRLISHTTGDSILGRFNPDRGDIEVRAGQDARGMRAGSCGMK